jgi:hypothetical protein
MDLFSLFIQWSLFLGVTIIVALRRQLTIFHPTSVYLLFHLLVFCVRPTLYYFYQFDFVFTYMGFDPSERVLAKTLNITSFSLFIFVIFFSLACHRGGITDMGERVPITPGHKKTPTSAATPLKSKFLSLIRIY